MDDNKYKVLEQIIDLDNTEKENIIEVDEVKTKTELVEKINKKYLVEDGRELLSETYYKL